MAVCVLLDDPSLFVLYAYRRSRVTSVENSTAHEEFSKLCADLLIHSAKAEGAPEHSLMVGMIGAMSTVDTPAS